MEQAPDRRVRLAYFVPPSQHFAGIERVVHEIASGLMEAHGDVLDVHVLFASHYDEDLLESTPYRLHVLGVDRLRNLAGTLRACVSGEDFDILVCPQVEASVIGWLATRGLGVPVFVSHLHGNPRLEEREGSRRTRIAFSMFRHVISRRIAAVLAVSPSLGRYAGESLAPHTRVYYAPNPVRDLGGTGRRPAGNGVYRLLSVGRLSRQKGQDILLRALALAIAGPGLPPVSLTLVGTGSDEDELKALSSVLGLDEVVTFAGYSSDPAEHFRSADCFVLPSRWEGFGVVLVEALQFGLPLLAADCEFGPSDVITDPTIGRLVAPGSVEALAEAITDAVQHGTDDGHEEQRRAVAGSYSRGAAAQQHFDILENIVSTHQRDGRLASFVAAQDR